MKNKHLLTVILTCLFVGIISWHCVGQKLNCDARISAFVASTNYAKFDDSFVSIPLYVGSIESEWDGEFVSTESVVAVMTMRMMYEKLDINSSPMEFSNLLLSNILRGHPLIVDSAGLVRLEPFCISGDDGELFVNMNTDNLLNVNPEDKILKKHFLPNYNSRCAMHNFLNNGISIVIDDESGFPYYIDFRE